MSHVDLDDQHEQGPPTVVVDARKLGDYVTITDALTVAVPGTRIIVRPGLYQEGIVIDKPVEIVGDGDKNDIVIQSNDKSAIFFKADNGRVDNMTLRKIGSGDYSCVDIAQGRLELEGCDISSQCFHLVACVEIGDGAAPRLRRNRIHGHDGGSFSFLLDGKTVGVLVCGNGQGTIEDNEIVDTTIGVWILEGGNPTLRRNCIHGCGNSGVYIHKNGQGTIEDNEIFANGLAGVFIVAGGNPTMRRNRVNKGGGGIFEDNDIRGNADGAWYLAEGSEVLVQRRGNKE